MGAEADPYGAIGQYRDPTVSDAPTFAKLCSFADDEHQRYVHAPKLAVDNLSRKVLDSVVNATFRRGRRGWRSHR